MPNMVMHIVSVGFNRDVALGYGGKRSEVIGDRKTGFALFPED